MSDSQQEQDPPAPLDSESKTIQSASLPEASAASSGLSSMPTPFHQEVEENPVPAPGELLAGRYSVLELLGQGGMGMVLAAYDSRLDRRVALKLLRSQHDSSSGNKGEARLEREAQAMARLNHPNVVHVYDTGTLEDGCVFIAMEYVEGQTLRQWYQRQSRSWREVLQVYLAAGRGLAAAHAAGLVHRDFKPDNVLVGDDGRVLVTDFGVARVEHTPLLLTPVTPLVLTAEAWEQPLTLPGTVVGTPKYMAPELLRGLPADARSDLYAFCIALYEALYRQRPFEGETLTERARAQRDGRLTPPPAQSPVPAWVTRAVLQGLQADPHQRPASMEPLLAALADDPEARRRAQLKAVGLASGVALLAVLAVWGWTRQQQATGCERMERRLAGVWDGEVKARMQAALRGTGLGYAQGTAERVSSALDGYAGRWVRMSVELCEAMRGQEGPPQGLAMRQEYCLERRRSQLRALTELLSREPDRELVPKAVQAVQSLPSLEYCADERALTAAVPPPDNPQVRGQAEALQGQVDEVEALLAAGKYKDGLAQGEELLRQVEQLEHAPLQAHILYLVGRLQEKTGDYKGAEERARQAMAQASLGKDMVLLTRAAALLCQALGWGQSRHLEALALEPLLEAVAQVAGNERARAEVLTTQGDAYRVTGKYEEAKERNERALTLLEKTLGPEHPDVAHSLNSLGNVYWNLGQYEMARALHARALALREKTLGPEHPDVAASLTNVGNALVNLGRLEEARHHYERALSIREQALGPEHPDVAASLNNMGVFFSDMGRHEEAKAHYERALAIREKTLGPEHARVAESLYNLCFALQSMGSNEEARPRCERALAIRETALGPEHSFVADSHSLLGNVLAGLKKWDKARQHLNHSLHLYEKALGPQHPDLIGTLLGLAELQRAQGRPALAIAPLERALAIATDRERADVQMELGDVLWASRLDRPRALALVAQARDYWRPLGDSPMLKRASEWLAARAKR